MKSLPAIFYIILKMEVIAMSQSYTHPETLVETSWVADHLDDPKVRIVESDEDILLYDTGHIPGAVNVDWFTTLQDPVRRDFLSEGAFIALCSMLGIEPDTHVVFYGDKNNWFACYSFWLFELYGHQNLKIMDGGRAKWISEGLPLTRGIPRYAMTAYQIKSHKQGDRAFRDEVFRQIESGQPLVDVRSPQEFSGELLHMPDYPQEGAQRAGHIPGAVNIPWSTAVNEDGTFKTPEELRQLYQSQGIVPDKDIIAYCRIGERSSLTWYVLKHLLGYPRVRNYDGSWTEWGNLVDAPIEK
jgi:thiosulfate/3-mercaptopyruvate sulfurtransferase